MKRRLGASLVRDLLLVISTFALLACGGGGKLPKPEAPPFEPGSDVVVCGYRVGIDTPVVLWTDPIGFDAYLERCRFADQVLPTESAS